jgi:uncharacterized membrane protein YhiD involved in acid resistance
MASAVSLAVAVALSAVIGFERQWRNRPVSIFAGRLHAEF